MAAGAQAAQALPDDVQAESERLAQQLSGLLEEQPNVVLLVERGRGPIKVQQGEYGQIMRIVPAGRRPTAPEVRIGGQTVKPVYLDSLTYQATTRGGRAVDSFLQGKAIYKDTSFITGYILLEAAEAVAALSDNDELATVLAVVGCLLTASSVVTNPAADIRQWDLAPDAYYLVAGTFPPGQHDLSVDGRRYDLTVSDSKQLVALLPALPPGGATELTIR